MKDYLAVLDWEWYVENNCKSSVGILPACNDWRLIVLETMENVYCQEVYGKYINYSDNCKLKQYLDGKGCGNALKDDNYGLMTIQPDWKIYPGKPSMVYIPKLQTNVIIRYISSALLAYLCRKSESNIFTLSLRPDYEICGDGIRLDRQRIEEAKEFGKGFEGTLESIKSVSKYYDDDWTSDWLLVSKDENGVTFEELLECIEMDQGYVVTQMVHFQYATEEGHEYITHIDHEFIFYSEVEYCNKLKDIRQRGKQRKRYKTFKIDNAHVLYVREPNENLLYQVLCNYFKKGNLVDEYFSQGAQS